MEGVADALLLYYRNEKKRSEEKIRFFLKKKENFTFEEGFNEKNEKYKVFQDFKKTFLNSIAKFQGFLGF